MTLSLVSSLPLQFLQLTPQEMHATNNSFANCRLRKLILCQCWDPQAALTWFPSGCIANTIGCLPHITLLVLPTSSTWKTKSLFDRCDRNLMKMWLLKDMQSYLDPYTITFPPPQFLLLLDTRGL